MTSGRRSMAGTLAWTNASLKGATLTRATFTGAIVTGVIWSNTICPDGTNSNKDGGTCIGHGI